MSVSPARASLEGEALLVDPYYEWDEPEVNPELRLYLALPEGGGLPTPETFTPCTDVEEWDWCGIDSTALSPDGQQIAMILVQTKVDGESFQQHLSLVTMGVDGQDREVVWEQNNVDGEYVEEGPLISPETLEYAPDGLSVLVGGVDPSNEESWDALVLSVDLATGERSVLVRRSFEAGGVGDASWSADGSTLVYMIGLDGYSPDGGRIVLATPEGETIRTINTGIDWTGNPRLSPDGTRIAFYGRGGTTEQDDPVDILVMSVGSESVQRLTGPGGGDDFAPSWSPDGQDILFQRATDWSVGPYLVRISPSGGALETVAEGVAANGAATRTASDLFGDRGSPGTVGNLDALLDDATSEAHVRWDPALDPRSEDGARGSGVAGYLVRYRQDGGSWSTQELVGEPEVVVAGSHTGEEIEVEVSAQDAANNIGDVATDTVEVASPTTGDFEAPGLFTSGELADRAGGYVGPEQLQLAVGAEDDEGDGVARVSVLAEDGQQLATSQADCSSGCPVETEETFLVNTGTLAEGPTTLRVARKIRRTTVMSTKHWTSMSTTRPRTLPATRS